MMRDFPKVNDETFLEEAVKFVMSERACVKVNCVKSGRPEKKGSSRRSKPGEIKAQQQKQWIFQRDDVHSIFIRL